LNSRPQDLVTKGRFTLLRNVSVSTRTALDTSEMSAGSMDGAVHAVSPVNVTSSSFRRGFSRGIFSLSTRVESSPFLTVNGEVRRISVRRVCYYCFHHHHHHWLYSSTWALAFLRSFCQLKYPAIASSDFMTNLFQGGVVSRTPNPRITWRADIFCQGCLP
jgi:hypothetical protein